MGISIQLSLERVDTETLATALCAEMEPLRPVPERLTDEQGRPMIALRLHPAAEALTLVDLGPEILVEAKTGTAGPGYHQYLCDTFNALRERGALAWNRFHDETGYLESGNRVALERAVDLVLKTTAMEALSLYHRGYRGIQLSLPDGYVFDHDEVIATPLGPRDLQWLELAAKSPEKARDVYPWWDTGLVASTWLGLAQSAMWIDVRWRAPVDGPEQERLLQIVEWLERGQVLDPALEWPRRELSEIYEFLGEESLRATAAHLRGGSTNTAPIGYRRRPVRVTLSGGWSILVPGELAEKWDERGVWSAWDRERSIWFSSIEVTGSPDSQATLEALPPLEGEKLGFERDAVIAEASISSSDAEGQSVLQIAAHAALGQHAAIGTFVVGRDDDAEWALSTWSTLAHLEEPRSESDDSSPITPTLN